MKLTAKIKLLPTPNQASVLLRTLETANATCTVISQSAWETKTFRQFDIHRLCYEYTRSSFALSAQMAVRCIAKVADAYKLDREQQRVFCLHGAIAYDDRILSWNMVMPSVSINPRDTSRTCSQPTCGYCDKHNRIDQAHFRCLKCGYTAPADYNAACNIRDWAVINRPMVSNLRVQAQAQSF